MSSNTDWMKLWWTLWCAVQILLQKWRTYSATTGNAVNDGSPFSAPFRDWLGWKTKQLSCSRSKQGALCSMPEQCRTYKDLAPLSQAGTALKSHPRSRDPQDISRGLHQLLPPPSHVSFPSFPQILISRVLLNKYLVWWSPSCSQIPGDPKL